MNIEAVKYHEGMSKKLDDILSKGDIRQAWIVRNDKNASEVIIAEDEQDAIRRYEYLLKARVIPPRPRRKKEQA